jgi:hypothetical protein
MRRTTFFLISSLTIALSTSTFAQSSKDSCDGAELLDVVGNVLVSTKDGIGAGVEKQLVPNKTRVTTTSRASVTISFKNCGCDVKLKENERIDIESPNTCGALLAAVTGVPVDAAIGAVAASSGGISTTGLIVGTTVGVGAYLLYRRDLASSPN